MRLGSEGAVGAATAISFRVLFCVVGFLIPRSASAQVIEIGQGGSIKVYDGAAVFNDEGVTPIIAKSLPMPKGRSGRAADRAAVASAAKAAFLSPDLVEAVAWRESDLRPNVVSRAGAVGVMQLMPGTARALGVDPRRTDQNLRGGATYLHTLMLRYGGDLMRALAAYNAGPKAVDRYGGVPPYKQTQAYVAAIMDGCRRLVALGANGSKK